MRIGFFRAILQERMAHPELKKKNPRERFVYGKTKTLWVGRSAGQVPESKSVKCGVRVLSLGLSSPAEIAGGPQTCSARALTKSSF